MKQYDRDLQTLHIGYIGHSFCNKAVKIDLATIVGKVTVMYF